MPSVSAIAVTLVYYVFAYFYDLSFSPTNGPQGAGPSGELGR